MRDRSRGGIGLTIASDQKMTQRSPGERRKLPPTRDLRLRKATLTNVAVDDVGLRAYARVGHRFAGRLFPDSSGAGVSSR